MQPLADTSAAPIIAFRGVSKRYGDVVAAADLELQIREGEFISLLGPSGCGKTTSLRMIAGFEQPSEGEVLIDGEVVNGVPAYRRPVNMVFQHYALFPHLDVTGNVSYGLRQRAPKPSAAAIEAQVAETLQLVRLVGYEGRRTHELSGGQQQRVALARALVNRPRVLLLDEPLAALDRKIRAQMQSELKRLQHEVGITFVVVTHDQEEAMSMADRIAVMHAGRIEQLASPAELYERPATRFVADFLGKSNFIRGRVVALDADRLIYEVGGGRYVQASAGAARQVGDEIVVALRPEKVEIRSAARPEDGANGIAGEISAWNYHGTSFHVLVETGALGELIVTAPAWHSEVEPEVGRRVHLVWSEDAAGVVAPD